MTCNKAPYGEREAYRTMRRMQKRIRGARLPIRVYYCQEHNAYHITSKPKRR